MTPEQKVIEFPSQHSLDLKRQDSFPVVNRPDGKYFICHHNALEVDEQRGMVTCKHCQTEMSPLEALKVLCFQIWWEENKREREIEYESKRMKIQREAFRCLFEAGVTAEKYANRLEKFTQERDAGGGA